MNDTVGMVVNYFWPSPLQKGHQLIIAATQLGLILLRDNPAVGSVVLVDGSPKIDESMKDICQRLDVRYLHAGRSLSLPEGYNLGWRSLAEPYVGLMANDILPYLPEVMELLLEWIMRPDIGCVFPCLNDCDYAPQLTRFFDPMKRPCEPAGMTLNLNLFKRSVLEQVGGVDEGYMVGFYDPILVMKIRECGFRVVQVGQAGVVHLNRLTKRQGGSTLTDEKHKIDYGKFFQVYRDYYAKHGVWEMSFWRWPFSTSRLASIFWWISQHSPSCPRPLNRLPLEKFTMWIEPLLTSYPTKYGNRKMAYQLSGQKENQWSS